MAFWHSFLFHVMLCFLLQRRPERLIPIKRQTPLGARVDPPSRCPTLQIMGEKMASRSPNFFQTNCGEERRRVDGWILFSSSLLFEVRLSSIFLSFFSLRAPGAAFNWSRLMREEKKEMPSFPLLIFWWLLLRSLTLLFFLLLRGLTSEK